RNSLPLRGGRPTLVFEWRGGGRGFRVADLQRDGQLRRLRASHPRLPLRGGRPTLVFEWRVEDRGFRIADLQRDGQLRRMRSSNPPPTLEEGIRGGTQSSSSRSFERTDRSSSVVVSPRVSSPDAIWRRRRRMILPLRVFGKASVNLMSSGRASAPISLTTWARNSSRSLS